MAAPEKEIEVPSRKKIASSTKQVVFTIAPFLAGTMIAQHGELSKTASKLTPPNNCVGRTATSLR
jgi:hypothetical protein